MVTRSPTPADDAVTQYNTELSETSGRHFAAVGHKGAQSSLSSQFQSQTLRHQTTDQEKMKMETKVPMPKTMDPDKMFGKEPAQVQCSNCHQLTTTRVEDSVSSEGWMFGICCCLFGSWITSLLVLTICVTINMSL